MSVYIAIGLVVLFQVVELYLQHKEKKFLREWSEERKSLKEWTDARREVDQRMLL